MLELGLVGLVCAVGFVILDRHFAVVSRIKAETEVAKATVKKIEAEASSTRVESAKFAELIISSAKAKAARIIAAAKADVGKAEKIAVADLKKAEEVVVNELKSL